MPDDNSKGSENLTFLMPAPPRMAVAAHCSCVDTALCLSAPALPHQAPLEQLSATPLVASFASEDIWHAGFGPDKAAEYSQRYPSTMFCERMPQAAGQLPPICLTHARAS